MDWRDFLVMDENEFENTFASSADGTDAMAFAQDISNAVERAREEWEFYAMRYSIALKVIQGTPEWHDAWLAAWNGK